MNEQNVNETIIEEQQEDAKQIRIQLFWKGLIAALKNCDVIKNRMISLGRLEATEQYGGGAYQAKRGDIIFLSSKHTLEDVTHAGLVSEIDHATGRVVARLVNEQDQIKKDEYNYKTNPKVVAFGNITD